MTCKICDLQKSELYFYTVWFLVVAIYVSLNLVTQLQFLGNVTVLVLVFSRCLMLYSTNVTTKTIIK